MSEDAEAGLSSVAEPEPSHTVSNRRKALGVPEQNEGTLRLQHNWAVGREDDRLARAAAVEVPAVIAKLAAALKGRLPPAKAMAGARAAAKRPRSKAWKRKMAKLWRERGNWLRPDSVPWTPEQDALLATASAARGGRPARPLARRGVQPPLRIGDRLTPRAGRRAGVRRLRLKAGLSQAALAGLAGVHHEKPGQLETGRERSVARAALERMAAALGRPISALTRHAQSH